MIGSWFARLSARRWCRRVAGQVGRLSSSHIRGVTWLLVRQNEALRNGDPDLVAKVNEELARFLAASAVAEERAVAALATCLGSPASQLSEPAVTVETVTVDALQASQTSLPAKPLLHRYSISSMTLAEAYAYLTQRVPSINTEPEFMLAVSGVRVGDVRTLERLIEVKMAHQSFGQASFDMQAFTKIALALYEHDQMLHAIFHSHRFAGPPAPSGTDTRLQGILEEGGYPAIQAVFSEDGYVRFFANKRPFAVEIHGTGVKPVDGHPDTFRIAEFSTLPHPTHTTAARGRGNGV